jgi:GDP-L-fucose synthase
MTEPRYPLAGRRVWVAGHRGMVGAAIVRRLEREDCEVLTVGREAVDLRRQAETEDWLAEARPDAVFLAAATVGGIMANDRRPADFIYDNLAIETNIVHGAHKAGVGKLLFLGSSCIYPRMAPQPIPEDALLTGPLEPTNQWYAIAKIAGIMLCQAYRRQYGCDFISAMPTNMYGPNDNYDLQGSHVLPALIRKFHEARESGARSVVCWGTGSPLREFLHADDCAGACLFLMENYSDDGFVNIGTGDEVSIRQLAELVKRIVGFEGEIEWDDSQPDGTPRKLLDCSKLFAIGWRPDIPLEEGVRRVCGEFEERQRELRL